MAVYVLSILQSLDEFVNVMMMMMILTTVAVATRLCDIFTSAV
jgi:hypothetical protein